MRTLKKAGAIVIKSNKVLLCKPFAFNDLILPGGVIGKSETPADALIREVKEELGNASKPNLKSVKYFGTYTDVAAGKKNTLVEIQCFTVSLDGHPRPSDEIKELIWFKKGDDKKALSPIIANHILPQLLRHKLLQ